VPAGAGNYPGRLTYVRERSGRGTFVPRPPAAPADGDGPRLARLGDDAGPAGPGQTMTGPATRPGDGAGPTGSGQLHSGLMEGVLSGIALVAAFAAVAALGAILAVRLYRGGSPGEPRPPGG